MTFRFFQLTWLVFCLVPVVEAKAKNLAETILSCNPGNKGSIDCYKNTLRLHSDCLVNSDELSCRTEKSVRSLLSDNMISPNCSVFFYASPSQGIFTISLEPHKKPSMSCTYQGYEVEVQSKGTSGTGGLNIDNATLGKDEKWSAPPPVIPIGLRPYFNASNIIVTEIQGRYQFGNGHDSVEYIPGGILLGESYEVWTKHGTEVTEATVRVAEAYGLEKKGYFLRADRHVIGKSKDFNYSVVSGFKPKEEIKICGHLVPKGTRLRLGTVGPGQNIQNVVAEGGVFIFGIPNLQNIKIGNEPPTKTLSCIPKAVRSSKFLLLANVLSDPKATPPPLPKVDYNDCECIAKEIIVDD